MKYVGVIIIIGMGMNCLYGEGNLELLKEIELDTLCRDITYNEKADIIYVTQGKEVWVINKDDEISDTLKFDTPIHQVVMNENTIPPTVMMIGEDSIFIYNAQTHQLVGTWALRPWKVAVGKKRVYMMFSGPQTNEYIVAMYSIDYRRFIDSFKVVIENTIFMDIKVNKNSENVYIVFESLRPEKNLGIVVDTNENVLDTLKFGESYSSQIWINQNNSTIYVTNYWYSGGIWKVKEEDFSISEITVATGMAEMGPSDIEGDPALDRIYGACASLSNSIVVIDGNKEELVDKLALDKGVFRIGVNPGTHKIYASTTGAAKKLYIIKDKVGVEEKRTEEKFRLRIVNNLKELIIMYEIPTSSTIELGVYDVVGRNIKTVEKGKKSEGFYRVKWDFTDKLNRKIGKGIYFIIGRFGDNYLKEKIILF